MRIIKDFATPRQISKTLAILLPGALQQPEDFTGAGFPEAVRRRGMALDLALADPGIQYIGETTGDDILRRIHEELVLPARQAGYQEIWLAGISIGGFMALAYAAQFPGQIDGLCLLAPYPGNRMLTNEIKAAGGLAHWQAPDEDGERRVWQWLRSHGKRSDPARISNTPCRPDMPRIHMAYGCEDRFATGQRMMAEAFNTSGVEAIPGGHDWPTWRLLWDNFLDRNACHFGNVQTGGATA